MKKLLIIAWSIFIIGILFRLFHFPGPSLLLILGTFLLVVHSVIFMVKNAQTDLPNAFLHLSYALLTVYLLFKIQYWSCGPMILGFTLLFIIVLLAIFTSFILFFTNKTKIQIPQILLVVYFAFIFVLSYTHSYSIYYFFNLDKTLNQDSRDTDYRTWDKYSWFLYIANKPNEALEANLNAQKALEEHLKIETDEKAIQYQTLLKQHNQKILENNWTSWP